ncbi:hypothetical protein S245_052821 [Arachis hypogaea]
MSKHYSGKDRSSLQPLKHHLQEQPPHRRWSSHLPFSLLNNITTTTTAANLLSVPRRPLPHRSFPHQRRAQLPPLHGILRLLGGPQIWLHVGPCDAPRRD